MAKRGELTKDGHMTSTAIRMVGEGRRRPSEVERKHLKECRDCADIELLWRMDEELEWGEKNPDVIRQKGIQNARRK